VGHPADAVGSQYVTDFVIGDRDSTGRRWTAVELEGPHRPMFNRSGHPAKYLWHAIRQVIDWRIWLELNLDYARRSPEAEGLGLEGISVAVPGLVVIGRRKSTSDRPNFRRALRDQLGIDVHTYDWLIDRARGRVNALKT
jgi:Domain of unknown function (DUF4263)